MLSTSRRALVKIADWLLVDVKRFIRLFSSEAVVFFSTDCLSFISGRYSIDWKRLKTIESDWKIVYEHSQLKNICT